jgi:hypothetical protein
MSIILNLFGESIRYWVCDISNDLQLELLQAKEKYQVDMETLLFDLDFLKHVGYDHWSELSNQEEKNGFFLTRSNRIEIKQNNHLLTKFRADELYNEGLLFPKYRVEMKEQNIENQSEENRMVIVQHEIGLFGKYQLETHEFDIDELKFHLAKTNQDGVGELLHKIDYQGDFLLLLKDDTVVNKTRVLF